jgi:hypothetical protein
MLYYHYYSSIYLAYANSNPQGFYALIYPNAEGSHRPPPGLTQTPTPDPKPPRKLGTLPCICRAHGEHTLNYSRGRLIKRGHVEHILTHRTSRDSLSGSREQVIYLKEQKGRRRSLKDDEKKKERALWRRGSACN